MTAVEQLGIAFRQWQKNWDSFEDTKKNKPVSFEEFIKPFLEMEKKQIIDACNLDKRQYDNAEQYYNETFKNK
jgi:hypothetical protein